MTNTSVAPTAGAAPSGASSAWKIYALETKYEFLKLWRMPVFALPTLLIPVMFYVLFGILFGQGNGGQGGAGAYYLATFGSFAVIAAALFGIGVSVAVERGQGWLEAKRASPMPPLAFFTAKIVTSLAFGLIIIVLLFVLGFAFGHVRMGPAEVLEMAGIESTGAIPFCAMGLAIGYLAGTNSAPAIVNLV